MLLSIAFLCSNGVGNRGDDKSFCSFSRDKVLALSTELLCPLESLISPVELFFRFSFVD